MTIRQQYISKQEKVEMQWAAIITSLSAHQLPAVGERQQQTQTNKLTSFTRLAVTSSSAMMLASSLEPKIAGDYKENGEEK